MIGVMKRTDRPPFIHRRHQFQLLSLFSSCIRVSGFFLSLCFCVLGITSDLTSSSNTNKFCRRSGFFNSLTSSPLLLSKKPPKLQPSPLEIRHCHPLFKDQENTHTLRVYNTKTMGKQGIQMEDKWGYGLNTSSSSFISSINA